MCVAFFNLICIARFCFSKNATPVNNNIRKYVASVSVMLILFFSFGSGHILNVIVKNDAMVDGNLPLLYPRAGNLLAFYVDYRELSKLSIPRLYDKGKVEEILAKFESKTPVDINKLKRPNIIAIMSESFADFKILESVDPVVL